MKNKLLSCLLPFILFLAFAGMVLLSGCAPGNVPEEIGETPPGGAELVVEAPRLGYRAPAFSLSDLEGKEHSLDDYAGQALILNFWTTWCRFCVQELPYLQELHASSADVTVLAVNVQEKKDLVANFIHTAGYTFTVLLDEGAAVAGTYLVRGLPTTFAVNAEGIITAVHVGSFDAPGLAELLKSTGVQP